MLTEAIRSHTRCEMIEVTARVRKLVRDQELVEGMVIIYVPHTTAAVTINENADADVKRDMLEKLAAMIPREESYYRHSEGNSDSHVKTSLVGNSVLVLVEEGNLVLGRWQGIYLCEFDGPRQRDIVLKIVSFAS